MNKKIEGYIKVKAEYELVYAQKESRASILTNTLEAPLQEVKVYNGGYEWEDGWRNMLIFGDNLLALKTMYEDIKNGGPNKFGLRDKIKLIYIDPPFATKQDFMRDIEKAYRDKVYGSQFLEFTRKRLLFLREILANDGGLYLHIDIKKGHYLKIILDEVFGEGNFMNELIWLFSGREMNYTSYNNKHNTIFFYAKNRDQLFFDWEKIGDMPAPAVMAQYKHKDEQGRKYVIRNLAGSKGLKEEGPDTYRQYFKPVPPKSYFSIPIVSSGDENVQYPTQKPEKLIEKFIKASSREGDIVMDCFAGSGTTLVTAEKLNRKWIGIDCGKLAIYTTTKRLLNSTTNIGSPEKDERPLLKRLTDPNAFEETNGLFFISEKKYKKQLEINDDFIKRLHQLLKHYSNVNHFSLVCPEEKFKINNYKIDEFGSRTFTIDNITYKISFIEPKRKKLKMTKLKTKSFILYNAGVYDRDNILQLRWEEYKEFVMKLFEVRKAEHFINGFKVDGYIGVHSAYIWDYPNRKNIAIDENYVKELDGYLKSKGGDRFYIIAPVQSINFMQDEIKINDTNYIFLKVPISVLIRLIEKGELGSLKQPTSEDNVNEVIDAFGFDFISQPQLVYTLVNRIKKIDNSVVNEFAIILKEFYANGLLYSPEDFSNFETLSLVLIDYNYKEEPFTMDNYLWGARYN